MATDTIPRTEPRIRLTPRARAAAAIAHADAGGLETLSMRTLAEALGVAPMALYRHVANKDDLIDGMVDVVFSEIELPASVAIGGPPCAGARSRSATSWRAIAGRSA